MNHKDTADMVLIGIPSLSTLDYLVGQLTESEMRTIIYKMEGFKDKAIAAKMEVSSRTVESNMQKARRKMGGVTTSRMMQYLTVWAYEKQLKEIEADAENTTLPTGGKVHEEGGPRLSPGTDRVGQGYENTPGQANP